MVWNPVTKRDECFHCGSGSHDTAGCVERERKRAEFRALAIQVGPAPTGLLAGSTEAPTKVIRDAIRFLRGGYDDQSTVHEAQKHEREALAALESVSKIVATAIEWRRLDESEPIGSAVPAAKLLELALLVDELNQ